MNRSLLLWAIAVGWSGPGMADDIHLSYGAHLLEPRDQPTSIRIASEEAEVKLRVFIDPSASPKLRYQTWQASGTLGVPIENGEILMPAAVDGSVVREISIPVPYAGAEKPLQFRIIVERIDHTENPPKRLATLDIVRRNPAELPEAVAAIKQAGIPMTVENENTRGTLEQLGIAIDAPASGREPMLITDVMPPPYDSEASTEIALLQKIQTRTLQMQNRKTIP